MNIKKELEKIEEFSNSQVKVNGSFITPLETSAGLSIITKDKSDNKKSVNMGLSNKENESKVVVSGKNPNDFGESKTFEGDYKKSLLDTIQKRIVPEIEKALK